ncbi:MAG: DUF6600 domain-containing protein [Acidobacteriota bacterium]
MRKQICLIFFLPFFFSIVSGEEIRYTERSFARLSHTTGNTFVQKAGDLAYEEGVINMPLAEGDRISTIEGRAEIYIGNGNYVRLDFNTKMDFTMLPSIENDLIQIKLWTGNIIVSLESLYKEKNIELHTADISIYVLDRGLYRLSVNENQNTEFFVYEGVVEAAGESESILLKDGQKLEAQRGFHTDTSLNFMAAANDSFYEWSQQRDSILRQNIAKKYLPQELNDFEYELHVNGHWNYVSPYGHVWVPRGIDPNWRPYSNGRWLWYPICGWTWLPYEPWGWVTFHYGRWHWSVDLGWYWIPTVRWGPAWVRWYRGNDCWAWTPLSYYGHPVVVINNVFYPGYTADAYPSNSRALTIVHKHQLRTKNLSEAVLTHSSLKNLGEANLTKGIPSVKDSPKPVSIDNSDLKIRLPLHPLDKTNTNDSRELADPNKQRIVSKEFGYPSSLRQKIDKYISGQSNKESPSIVEKALKYFSSGKSQYIKSRTDYFRSVSSSKKTTSSPPASKSSSLSRTTKSVSQSKTSSAAKTRKSSAAKTVKKKKK